MAARSQRIHPDTLLDLVLSTFSKSAIDDFRAFLARHPGVTKWMLASDFVINEPLAANDAYVFTFFPCNDEINQLRGKIAQLVPKDFKKTKVVEPKLQKFFQSGETFTICLLTPKKYDLAGDIYAVRRALDQTLSTMREWGMRPTSRRSLKHLRA
jgi:hypothetical protein